MTDIYLHFPVNQCAIPQWTSEWREGGGGHTHTHLNIARLLPETNVSRPQRQPFICHAGDDGAAGGENAALFIEVELPDHVHAQVGNIRCACARDLENMHD